MTKKNEVLKSSCAVLSAFLMTTATAGAETIYLECTTSATPGPFIAKMAGMTCQQVPSNRIVKLPEKGGETKKGEPSAEIKAPSQVEADDGQGNGKDTLHASAPVPPAVPVEAATSPLIAAPTAQATPTESGDKAVSSEPASQPKTSSESTVELQVADKATAPSPVKDIPADNNPQPMTYGPVRPGENVYQIALHLFPNERHRLDAVANAFVDTNPSAFAQGNPNRIRAGAVLKIPTKENIDAAQKALQRKAQPEPMPSAPTKTREPAQVQAPQADAGKIDAKPNIMILPGGAKPKEGEGVEQGSAEKTQQPPAPQEAQEKAVPSAPQSKPMSNDDAKKALMQEIEAIKKQMMELNAELQKSSGKN